MEDEQYPHLVREESRADSQAEEVSSPPHTHSQSREPTPERKSDASEHGHHHHQQHSAQAETTTSAAATSMMPEMTNYNVNVQFDPATLQAGKPTNLSLIV